MIQPRDLPGPTTLQADIIRSAVMPDSISEPNRTFRLVLKAFELRDEQWRASIAQQAAQKADWTEPHPPSRLCMCPSCIPSFDDRFKPQQAQQPVAWRAVLSEAQKPHQLNTDLHVVLIKEKRHAESWIASKEDFDGWHYTLEPLYTAPPAQSQQSSVEAERAARQAAQVRVEELQAENIRLQSAADHACGLLKTQQAAGVPEGWKLVPVEPTESMLKAEPNGGYEASCRRRPEVWVAMLAAAPTAAAQVPVIPNGAAQAYEAIKRLNTPGMYQDRFAPFIEWFDAAMSAQQAQTAQEGGAK